MSMLPPRAERGLPNLLQKILSELEMIRKKEERPFLPVLAHHTLLFLKAISEGRTSPIWQDFRMVFPGESWPPGTISFDETSKRIYESFRLVITSPYLADKIIEFIHLPSLMRQIHAEESVACEALRRCRLDDELREKLLQTTSEYFSSKRSRVDFLWVRSEDCLAIFEAIEDKLRPE